MPLRCAHQGRLTTRSRSGTVLRTKSQAFSGLGLDPLRCTAWGSANELMAGSDRDITNRTESAMTSNDTQENDGMKALQDLSVQDVVMDVAYHFDGGITDDFEYDVQFGIDALLVVVTHVPTTTTRTFVFQHDTDSEAE